MLPGSDTYHSEHPVVMYGRFGGSSDDPFKRSGTSSLERIESRRQSGDGRGPNGHIRRLDFVRLHGVRHMGLYLAEVDAAYDDERMVLVVSVDADRTLKLECPCDARNARAVMSGKPAGLLDREGRSVLFNWPRPGATEARRADGRDGRYRHPTGNRDTTLPTEVDYLRPRNRFSNRR